MIRLGVIGFGSRIQGILAIIEKFNAGAVVTAITDVRNNEIKKVLAEKGKNPAEINFYTDPDEMLRKEKFDGVLIGTRCSLHARMALKVFATGLPLYLEKPIATNMEDWLALREASKTTQSRVVVSFPLRVTPLVQAAREMIDCGKIGAVQHVQAVNNPTYADVYFMHWYRDEEETGGLFLQKATHDFDYINYLLGRRPVRIAAMKSKQVYKGAEPAGKQCDICEKQEECPESPFCKFYTRALTDGVIKSDLMCGFAVDTGNEDSSSALIEYEDGMHAVYTQNFFSRKAAGTRGARLIGYKGTITFDWYTDELKVFMHHTPRTETHNFSSASMSHGGGDVVLAHNFLKVIKGEAESVSPLSAGLLSVLMCLKAKESAETSTFREIEAL